MSYYIAPKFFDKVAVHITKNFLDLPLRVPLILGIHGRKGEGKSFQCELVFRKMGIEAVHMSAGELESPDAGDPARLIRLRYREAAEVIKVRGRMCVLMINDLDAGAGRFDQGTQYTVNTQLVNGTLMNIADNPTDVQLPGSYDSTPLPRIPILVTGNDFSTLYAPLIRDGRMEKFYWEPNRDDKVGIVGGIFADDGLSTSEVEKLVDTFSGQAVDFYSALRSRIYDEQIRQFIYKIGIERVSQRVVNSTEGKPVFDKPNFRLNQLLEIGNLMVREQEQVQNTRLVDEYNLGGKLRLRKIEHSEPKTSNNSQSFSNEASKSATYVEKEVSKTINRNDIANEPITHHQESNGQRTKRPSQDAIAQLQQILQGGYRVGIEYVDARRFRMNSWQSYATVSNDEGEAIATLADCLTEHEGDYIRLIGIDPKAKRRVVETIIQRPNN